MKTNSKKIKRQPFSNDHVEKLDHMIDHSISRKKSFKQTKKTPDERALLEMIDTRIGHMLTKSCELEAKLDGIERRKQKRIPGAAPSATTKAPEYNQRAPIRNVNKFSSRTENVVKNQKPMYDTQESYAASFSETIPKLVSPSKVLVPEQPRSLYKPAPKVSNNNIETLLSLIQNLASEISEMHEEQNILNNQIEKLQEYIFEGEGNI